jgi:hypothetical protein
MALGRVLRQLSILERRQRTRSGVDHREVPIAISFQVGGDHLARTNRVEQIRGF